MTQVKRRRGRTTPAMQILGVLCVGVGALLRDYDQARHAFLIAGLVLVVVAACVVTFRGEGARQ